MRAVADPEHGFGSCRDSRTRDRLGRQIRARAPQSPAGADRAAQEREYDRSRERGPDGDQTASPEQRHSAPFVPILGAKRRVRGVASAVKHHITMANSPRWVKDDETAVPLRAN